MKKAGLSKKSADLEYPYGVQDSAYTGIARRVRLRNLLADVLPVYVAGLVSKPPLWKVLGR